MAKTYHCDACDTDVPNKDRGRHEASAGHLANVASTRGSSIEGSSIEGSSIEGSSIEGSSIEGSSIEGSSIEGGPGS